MKFSYIKLLMNIGKITSFFTLLSTMVTVMIAGKKVLPNKQDARRVLDALRSLIDAGIITVDQFDVHQISDAINNFETEVLGPDVVTVEVPVIAGSAVKS